MIERGKVVGELLGAQRTLVLLLLSNPLSYLGDLSML